MKDIWKQCGTCTASILLTLLLLLAANAARADAYEAMVMVGKELSYCPTLEKAFADAISAYAPATANSEETVATVMLNQDVSRTSETVFDISNGNNPVKVIFSTSSHSLSGNVNIRVGAKATLTFKGGSLSNNKSNLDANGTAIVNFGTLIIDKGSISGIITIRNSSSATMTVNNGTITGSDRCIQNEGTLTVNGGTFVSPGVAIGHVGGTFNLNTLAGFGNYSSSNTGRDFYIANGCKVNFTADGKYNKAPSTARRVETDVTLRNAFSSGFAQYVKDKNGNAIALASVFKPVSAATYCFDLVLGEGYVMGNLNHPVAYTANADGSELKFYTTSGDVTNKSTVLVNACGEVPTGGILGLMDDVDLTDSELDFDKTSTLDLNGHKLESSNGDAVIENTGTLTITDSGTGGAIIGGEFPAIVSSNMLTLENGTISSRGNVAVYVQSKAVINGGTIDNPVCRGVYSFGLVIVNGGTIIGNECAFINMGGIQVNGGTFVSRANNGAGIDMANGELYLNAIPNFSLNDLNNAYDISFSCYPRVNFSIDIASAPATPVKLKIDGPYSNPITSKYSTFCDGIAPDDMFKVVNDGCSDYAIEMLNGELALIEVAEVKFAPCGFATYYHSTKQLVLPTGVKAYIVTDTDGEGKLTYVAVADGNYPDGNYEEGVTSNTVAADAAVLLQKNATGNDETVLFSLAASDDYFSGTNLLRGLDMEFETFGEGLHYKLCYGDDNTANGGQDLSGTFGWYYGATDGGKFTVSPHRAWLVLPDGSNARQFALPGIGAVTGVKDRKYYNDGASPDWYTASGIRLNAKPSRPGVYVNVGRKVVVK